MQGGFDMRQPLALPRAAPGGHGSARGRLIEPHTALIAHLLRALRVETLPEAKARVEDS